MSERSGSAAAGAAFVVFWLGGLAYVMMQAGGGPRSGAGTLLLYALAFAPALVVFVWRGARGESAVHEGPLMALVLVWAIVGASSDAAELARLRADEEVSACARLQCAVRHAVADESAPASARKALLEHFANPRRIPHSCPLRAELGQPCETSPECRFRIEGERLTCAEHGKPRPVRGRSVFETMPKCDAPDVLPASVR